jgi:hypothetical protein
LVADPVLSSKYWLVRKVVAVIGYYGGFRNVELKSLKFGFLLDAANNPTAVKVWEKSDDGSFWFNFYRSKQRGCKILSQICVPKCSKEMVDCRESVDRVPLGVCPASVIDQYLNVLATDLNCSIEELQGDFFKSTHGKNANQFVRVPFGKNKLARVGIEFAEELMLPNPGAYTGHCWRRSCSTNSSDAGVNVTSLMAHMGWTDPKTAIRYVAKSKQSAHQMAMYLCNAQRFNLDPEDLFRFPKVVPGLKSSNLPSRVEVPPTATLILPCPTVPSEVSCVSSSILSARDSHHCQGEVDNKDDLKCDEGENAEIETGSEVAHSLNHAVESVMVTPVVKDVDVSIESSLASRLSALVGSIVNSGSITFNIQLGSK